MIETFFACIVIAVFLAYLLAPRKARGRMLRSPPFSTTPPPEPPKPIPNKFIPYRMEIDEGGYTRIIVGLPLELYRQSWTPVVGSLSLKESPVFVETDRLVRGSEREIDTQVQE